MPSTLVYTSAANWLGTNTLISQQRKHLNFVWRNFSSCPTYIREQCYKTRSWCTHHQYGTTVSNATSTKSTRFSGTLRVSPVVITDGQLAWQPCCRSCSWIHSNNDELAAGSWCCTESEMVWSPYLLQPTLNQFPTAPEGSKRDICRFSAIQAHTVRPCFQVQSGHGTLPVDICQLSPDSFKTHLSSFRFIWAPDYTSCFYHLHCTVFIWSYCSLFAARLSQHTSAYSLVVRYCSESSRHLYRKMMINSIDGRTVALNCLTLPWLSLLAMFIGRKPSWPRSKLKSLSPESRLSSQFWPRGWGKKVEVG